MKLSQYLVLVVFCMLFSFCANYKPHYFANKKNNISDKKSDIIHSIYLVGDAGNSKNEEISPTLKYLDTHLKNTSKNTTLLFLGDNIYPSGIPKKSAKEYDLAKHRLDVQIAVAKKFSGKTFFIPGNHDWYSGLKGLKRQQKAIENALGKKSFLPRNGCPLAKINISENIVLILVDTHWYLTNWNKHPTINDDCEIKTREKFFDEFEGLIKKARGKTTLIAMHHPMFSNGPHDGNYSLGSHFKPFPILGTLKNILRKTTGISHADLQNKKYNELKKRIVTLSQENDKIIFLSGHEHNLQYILQDNIPQIISGSGSKVTATKNKKNGLFSYGVHGFSKLDIYENGSSKVSFYGLKEEDIVFQSDIFPADKRKIISEIPVQKATTKVASIYKKEEVLKGKMYRAMWGERYRKYFGTNIKVPIVYLDTLYGGLIPVRKGGGHQSKSLRLKDKEGREYVMRALRKNALQYLQAVAFKDQYMEGKFDETTTENLLLDIFTGSHPYAPFTIGTLADAVAVFHTNPVLYYIPKQNSLGDFNTEFGDELYMIEERAASGHGDKASFGFSNKVISTDDLLKKLQKNEHHILDEAAYIRARLFDMLIGDWDRHEDQWRWAVFKDKKQTYYKPIPRDRDQAFSIFGDGILLNFATKSVPALRLMQSYKETLESPEWFNLEPYPLDMTLINQSTKDVWDTQVAFIIANLTDEIIDKAFAYFPDEVKDKTIIEIKKKLQGRRKNLQHISDTYFYHINKFQVVKGTHKKDEFVIKRLPNGQTEVTAYRIKKGKEKIKYHQRKYAYSETKEIWIYGLDDDDTFVVDGIGDKLIKLLIIGGQNKDTYDIRNDKKVKVYDYKSKKSVFITPKVSKKLTDDYHTNVYDYKKLKSSSNLLNPVLGFNPDDGLKVGLSNVYTVNGFERNPFTSQHTLSGAYYLATNGFELNYASEFSNIIGNWNLGVNALYTTPNYAINFFGYGNSTSNLEAKGLTGKNYNRVKIRQFSAGSFMRWKGHLDARIQLELNFQSFKIENTTGRFIEDYNIDFNNQNFVNVAGSYRYENTDNSAFPTMGMKTELQVGYTSNVMNARSFGYVIPYISFHHKLISSGQLVLATKLKGHFTLGNDFEFYQAATIGGNDGLRGFRNQRFTGKNSFYHSSDIRFNLRQIKTSLLPLNIGIYGGFDYGKVWLHEDAFINRIYNLDELNISYGGGVFFNAANMMTGNVFGFHSDDGFRLGFSLGFAF